MTEKEKTLHRILTAAQTGTIVCRIAQQLGVTPYEAFRRFIASKTYAIFRQPGSLFSYWGDPAIVDEFLTNG